MASLFGGGDSAPAPAPAPAPLPIPEPIKATPMVDEAAITKKKKKKFAEYQARGGRQSTILGESETLG